MNKTWIIVVVLLILGGALWAGSWMQQSQQTTAPQSQEPIGGSKPSAQEDMTSIKTFNVNGTSFMFDPKEIKVKKGDTVRINFTNKDTEKPHNFVVNGLNVRTKMLPAGQSETVEFVVDKAGTFEIECSVGNGYHKAQGMTGSLIVE